MNASQTTELHEFHRFLTTKLSNGGADLSPEEAVDEWRELHPEPEIDEKEVAAIQEAIDDMVAGDRGRPADEVIADLRKLLGMPSN
jgi:hypothetical protein